MKLNIIAELENSISNYYGDTITIVEGLDYSQYETLKRIEYFSNSKYLSGGKDALGRDKPFYNIINAKVNYSVTATDMDTKDIAVKADNGDAFDKSFLIQREVQEWIKESNFALMLNQAGETRARYGGVFFKKVMKNGKLHIEIPQWKNLITDQTDIKNGVVIEMHYLSPAEITKRFEAFNQDIELEDVIKLSSDTRGGYGDKAKTISKYIPVYEIHGEFPETYIDENGDENKYVQQYHLIAGADNSKKIVLHSEKEKESPYKYVAWRNVPGRGLGVGVVEDGFEAQIWTNDAKIKEREANDIASRVVFQTDDDLVQNNILTDLDNGSIIKTSPGRSIGQLNTISNAIPLFSGLVQSWDDQFSKVSSIYDTNAGDALPSGTPFRLAAIQTQNANSLFQYRREEFGIFLREVFMDWVIPYVLNRLKRASVLASDFSQEELQMIDKAFTTYQTNKEFTKQVLEKGQVLSKDDWLMMQQQYQDFIGKTKARRFLELPDDYFKDITPKIDIVTTGEQINKAAVLETLNNIIVTVSNNPGVLQDPVLSKIFGRIIEIADAGLSPIELGIGINKPAQQMQPQAPQGQPQGARMTPPDPKKGQMDALVDASNPEKL